MNRVVNSPVKNTIFILFYLIPLCYMYMATVANYFEYKSYFFSLITSRSELLVAVSFFGIFYVLFNRKKPICSTSFLTVAIWFGLYMFWRGLISLQNNEPFLSFFSIVVLWVIVLFVSLNVTLNIKEKQLVAQLFGSTGAFLAILYIWGRLSLGNISVEGINSIYYVLCSIPFIFLIKNFYLKILLFVITAIALIISGKSLSIISLVIILFYALLNYKTILPKKNYILPISSLILVVLALYNLDSILDYKIDVFELMDDLSTDLESGSGRYHIYEMVYHNFIDSNIIQIVFGHGYNGVVQSINIGSHNDFLLVLFDYGLVGFSLYVLFIISLFLNRKKYPKKSSESFAYNLSVMIFLLVSTSSNFINTQIQMLFFVILWGLFNIKPKLC